MPYLSISDFKYGMDQRRPRSVGIPGTLWNLQNGVITRGGDINGAKSWVPIYNPLTGTFGLYILLGQPYVFGSGTRPGTLPAQVNYQQLAAPDSSAMTGVLDVKANDGKLYVIAEYAGGGVYHFYNGTRVSSWDSLSTVGNSFGAVATILAQKIAADGNINAVVTSNSIVITAKVAGTPFTIASSTVDNGSASTPTAAITHTQANVVGVPGVPAVGSVQITGGSHGGITQVAIAGPSTVNLIPPPTMKADSSATLAISGGTSGAKLNFLGIIFGDGSEYDVLSDEIDWAGSNAAMAAQIANSLNSSFSDDGSPFNATVNGATVTITNTGQGAANNGATLDIVASGMTVTTTPFAGGTDASQPVPWTTNRNTTAGILASVINQNYNLHGFTATVSGPIVTITAPAGSDSAWNGATTTTTVQSNVTKTDTNFSGGTGTIAVAQIETVVISGGSFDPADTWTLTINGVDYTASGTTFNIGRSLFVMKSRVYSTAETLLRYCVLNDPTDWATDAEPATDAGFINISTDAAGSQSLVGVGTFNFQAAIFSEINIVVYQLNADATTDNIVTFLERTGTFAAKSIVSYGNLDVYYLTRTGIRSIRAQVATTTPYLADVGSVIDSFVQDYLATLDENTLARAVAEIEPIEGRYMLAAGSRVITLANYPENKVVAWSYMDPGFTITDMGYDSQRLWARDATNLYVYGGMDGNTYPGEGELPTVVETPFMSANDPAGMKILQGFDAGLSGDWVVQVLPDPNDLTQIINVGTLSKTTYPGPSIKIPGRTTHVAFRFTCQSAGQRILSNLAIHYSKEGSS